MAATPRATPSFAPPATQNTAPVHEFRCLYTHDIRKKAKKWHDGSARYHTFNKRVMVYDDTKNYIGDLHYRADEAFGEGIELQLDRGVLVEVGERTGETHTDLTGIIHTSHANSNGRLIQPSDARAHTVQQVNDLNGQRRPKSLTELLGTSQSRHGRARLIATSPFEQQKILSEVQQVEPRAKRQKLVLGKENSPTGRLEEQRYSSNHSTTQKKPQISEVAHGTAIQLDDLSKGPQDPRIENAPVFDLSSDEDVQVIANDKTSSGKMRSSLTGNANVRTTKSVEPKAMRDPLPAPKASANDALKPTMSRLRMKPLQPRKRLLYKTLLPSSLQGDQTQATVGRLQESGSLIDVGDNQVAVTAPVSGNVNFDEVDTLDGFNDTDGDDLFLRENHKKSPQNRKTPERPAIESETVEESPLFVTQTLHHLVTTASQPVEDNFETELMGISRRDSEHAMEDITTWDEAQTNVSQDIPEPDSPCFPPPPPLKPAVENHHSSEISRSPSHLFGAGNAESVAHRYNIPTPNVRTFTRSLSTDNQPFRFDPRTSFFHQFSSRSLETMTNLVSNPTSVQASLLPLHAANFNDPSPCRSPLQRSHSDTDIFVAAVGASMTGAQSSCLGTEEQGPWTTMEAFLLFDKWPTCKEKSKPRFQDAIFTRSNAESSKGASKCAIGNDCTINMDLDDGNNNDDNGDNDDDDAENEDGSIDASATLPAKQCRGSPRVAKGMMIRSARSVLQEQHGQ